MKLYNTFVTNGYMTADALTLLVEAGLDAMNVDIKGNAGAVFKYGKGIDVENVWARCRQASEFGLHLEITTLIIPGVNDSDPILQELGRRIISDLGPDTPWHVSGYYPACKFHAPPTPVAALERACSIGRHQGLKYVYPGNLPGYSQDNTYCPRCGKLLIERFGFELTHYELTDGHCTRCREVVAGVGWERLSSRQRS
jgi:pyruvate formate lyase activating enzyme